MWSTFWCFWLKTVSVIYFSCWLHCFNFEYFFRNFGCQLCYQIFVNIFFFWSFSVETKHSVISQDPCTLFMHCHVTCDYCYPRMFQNSKIFELHCGLLLTYDACQKKLIRKISAKSVRVWSPPLPILWFWFGGLKKCNIHYIYKKINIALEQFQPMYLLNWWDMHEHILVLMPLAIIWYIYTYNF